MSAPDYTHLIDEARREMTMPRLSCVNCGKPCLPGLRWCSTTCFYFEDGYPDYDTVEPNEDAA